MLLETADASWVSLELSGTLASALRAAGVSTDAAVVARWLKSVNMLLAFVEIYGELKNLRYDIVDVSLRCKTCRVFTLTFLLPVET